MSVTKTGRNGKSLTLENCGWQGFTALIVFIILHSRILNSKCCCVCVRRMKRKEWAEQILSYHDQTTLHS
jgi:hypothetical protein